MPVIMRAARGTRYVCEHELAWHRWNCSSIGAAPDLRADLMKGTREQAYVYALSAAAVMHQVAQACVSGEIAFCPCGANPPDTQANAEFKWKGCSDNVAYGHRVSREWADAPWRMKAQQMAQGGAQNDEQATRRRQRKDRVSTACNLLTLQYQSRVDNDLHTMQSDRSLISMDNFMHGSEHMSPRMKMNAHNNEAGRLLTAEALETKCKCHGVSNSCNLKTCWKVLPRLEVIAARLSDKYMHATEVRAMLPHESSVISNAANRRGDTGNVFGDVQRQTDLVGDDDDDDGEQSPQTNLLDSESADLEPVTLMRTVAPTDLVYVRNSPDYCTTDARVGSVGTRARECNTTVHSHASCDSMCCGRGYDTVTYEDVRNCHCKYVHCCYVKCDTCTYTVYKHYCK